ncbi:helicase associated domain-containing protein [Curtobacterium sp. MCBD17_040]|uniref:helicase associated domain-containing protein n=1 Tax=Curtobacterium sp. MCBD17_040 TaxID=2175674 RepID=UPI0015E8A9F7|nr:helicase associated domain-containing protein [Curtobacterium sp. MCBD17_040]WIB65380.1 helicase associated domain-containing protein [Curtobacterium sp. MCBD17_040]
MTDIFEADYQYLQAAHRAGHLDSIEERALSELLGEHWYDRQEQRWRQHFTDLLAFQAEHGHAEVPQRYVSASGLPLGTWTAAQRQLFRRGELAAERAQLLETVTGWAWDRWEASWRRGYTALLEFRHELGHANPSRDYVTPAGLLLGKWVITQRAGYAGTGSARITPERAHLLESIPGWYWTFSEAADASRRAQTSHDPHRPRP